MQFQDGCLEEHAVKEGSSDNTQNTDEVEENEQPCGEGNKVFKILSSIDEQETDVDRCSELVITVSKIKFDRLNPIVFGSIM